MTEHRDIAFEGHNALRIEIVTKLEQFMHVMAVRAICYMEDTLFPADQAFDGNDFQCTHVVVYLQDEPIGAVRIRWFKDFAKIERTAFRPRYRDVHYLKALADFVFSHIARKGYARAITHASPKYARLWRMLLGMKRVPKPAATYFGEEYVELAKDLDVPANAIRDDSAIEVLFRTEGAWDSNGRYETAR
ncbi:MAG TPA: GNAT family N-acetyltransferase [Rhizomicrobium sp.]|nr:GNAT family N-acetyltransferase [Rhizomicrobium sp.]